MILPGLAYLAVFFVVPFYSLARTSLFSIGWFHYLPTLTFNWDFGNYLDAFSHYQDQIIRTFTYAFTATALCLLLAFPLAYPIAFKAGRYKNLILGLVILPFFVYFLLLPSRGVPFWPTMVGWSMHWAQWACCPAKAGLLSTSWAVISAA